MRLHVRSASLVFGLALLVACGGASPPATDTTPSKPIAAAGPAVDLTPVTEPDSLVVIGRVAKPEAILKTVGGWTRLPLPNGNELVRSISDEAVGDAVDLSQPVDAAVSLGGSARSPRPLIAVSAVLRNFDDAKAKIGAKHKLTPAKNGSFIIEGIGRAAVTEKQGRGRHEEEDDEEGETCAIAPAAPSGARLVCGERDALEALQPYLTRNAPKQQYTSDVHIELRPGPMREPLQQVKAALPFLARSLMGNTSPALRELLDASVNELFDFVQDTTKISLDAQLADAGMNTTVRIDYQKANSFIAKLATSSPDRADVPPPAFFHLPAETDIALYGKGSDPKLFDHPRELIGKVALETTEGAGMPETERKAVRELVVDRMLGLFTGPLVYGKGFDAAALDKALAARKTVKAGDLAAEDEVEKTIAEQVVGYHLVQVNDPITKVGPILKDWANLWNRPAFAKWAKAQASNKMLAQMRIAGAPAGVTLPKDAVHLEIVLPRPDLEELPAPQAPSLARPNAGPPGAKPGATPPAPTSAPKPAPPKPGKKIPRKPIVLHVIAVPDQGGTWIGFGLDGKLVAQKAAASLSTAPDGATLGKSGAAEALRDVKANGAWLATLKGFAVFTATDRSARAPYGLLGTLPNKGTTPIVLSFVAQGPNPNAQAGSAVATFKLTRPAIEDIVKLVFSSM